MQEERIRAAEGIWWKDRGRATTSPSASPSSGWPPATFGTFFYKSVTWNISVMSVYEIISLKATVVLGSWKLCMETKETTGVHSFQFFFLIKLLLIIYPFNVIPLSYTRAVALWYRSLLLKVQSLNLHSTQCDTWQFVYKFLLKWCVLSTGLLFVCALPTQLLLFVLRQHLLTLSAVLIKNARSFLRQSLKPL